jgi:hypothetical protein
MKSENAVQGKRECVKGGGAVKASKFSGDHDNLSLRCVVLITIHDPTCAPHTKAQKESTENEQGARACASSRSMRQPTYCWQGITFVQPQWGVARQARERPNNVIKKLNL